MRKGMKHVRPIALLLLLAMGVQAAAVTGTPVAMAEEPGEVVVRPWQDVPEEPTPTPIGEVSVEPGSDTTVTGGAVDPATKPDPDSVALSTETLALHPVEEVVLGVTGVVTGAGCSIVMNSSDTHVATAKNNGTVRGENPGSAVITVQVLWYGAPVKELSCAVSVTAGEISYKKLRKKLYGKRGGMLMFKDDSSSESTLTFYGFFYKSFKLHPENYYYGSGDETITLYPQIYAKKDGSHSKLQFGIWLSSFVEIANRVSRSYKSMKFSGGGESFKISGSTNCRAKTIGSYIRWQIRTNGDFYISMNSNTHLSRLDKLVRILSCKKPKIIVKDVVDGRTFKCHIAKDRAKGLKKMIKKYKKLLKAFW